MHEKCCTGQLSNHVWGSTDGVRKIFPLTFLGLNPYAGIERAVRDMYLEVAIFRYLRILEHMQLGEVHDMRSLRVAVS
jgi:hypothetical protein